ncbi:exosortase X [Pontibacter ramchanderi]|uniref:Exosortase family protein XrtF n=1 Tax=Pontibacter ramchanderi TaxID=1179743 RepID=A0A2N3V1J9_9BACT|nr:archaeosortase/exosortase family protein [Pontibacter ramchanderi]PKV75509.1 exosortase family protein XrtF [Pontibacter ramchanderi]
MQEYKQVLRFLLYALGLCLCWFLLYDFWLSDLDNWLTLQIVHATVYTINMLGYNAAARDIMIQINGVDVVFVYHACNGMVLMALFAGFIIAFPGPLSKKLIYIPLGIVLINLLNILRVTALALNAHHFSHTVDFNHKYTFTLVVYAAIFMLWMYWVKRFSGMTRHVDAQDIEI